MPFPVAPVAGQTYQDTNNLWVFTNGAWKRSKVNSIVPPVMPLMFAGSGTIPLSASGGFVRVFATAAVTLTLPDPTLYPGFSVEVWNQTAFTATLATPVGSIYDAVGNTPVTTRTVPTGARIDILAQGGGYFAVQIAQQNTVHGSVTFTTPGAGSWTVPDGVYYTDYIITGGGGGGAGCNTGAGGANTYMAGGGGGGAGTVIGNSVAVTPGQIIPYTVGAGGAGGTPGGSLNGTGGTLSTIYSAVALGGTPAVYATSNLGNAGDPGTFSFTGFGVGVNGGQGEIGQNGNYILSAHGGGSYWGPGGIAVPGGPTAVATFCIGAGGGGAFNGYNSGASPGGTGHDGLVMLKF